MLCRYCQLEKIMTREHIIPRFIYKFLKSATPPLIGWNERAGKLISGEATIADVCGDCNGGALSDLDAYGKFFLENNGFLSKVYTKEKTDINYNYDILLRWLLKICYNAVTAKNDPSLPYFEKHKDYILNGAPPITQRQITLFIGLASPVNATDDFCAQYPELVSKEKLCGPFSFHINEVIKPYLEYNAAVTGVTIGNLFFHIAIFDNFLLDRSELINTMCNISNLKVLNPKSSVISISTCGMTWLERGGKQKKREKLSIMPKK